MGRPRELTDEQRADLIARGYRSVEIWVMDRGSTAYRKEAARQAESAAEADRRDDDIDEWIAQVRGNLWSGSDEAP